MLGKISKRAGDRVDDRVATTREGEIGKAHAFFARELAVAESGLSESAEKVGTRIGFSLVEFGVQIVFQCRACFELTARDFENMDAPADPCFAFGLRHVEQVG